MKSLLEGVWFCIILIKFCKKVKEQLSHYTHDRESRATKAYLLFVSISRTIWIHLHDVYIELNTTEKGKRAGIMGAAEKTPSNQEWHIRLLCILFDIVEDEIPESLHEDGQDIPTQQVVERAIEIAKREKAISLSQLDILEQFVGRYGPRKTLGKIAQERGSAVGNIGSQKTHALQNLSASRLLQKLIHSPFEPGF